MKRDDGEQVASTADVSFWALVVISFCATSRISQLIAIIAAALHLLVGIFCRMRRERRELKRLRDEK